MSEPEHIKDILRRMRRYDAEAKMGELIKENPPTSMRDDTGQLRGKTTLPEGVSWNLSSQCEQLAEGRLGEILDARPENKVRGSRGGTSKPLIAGIDKRHSHETQHRRGVLQAVEDYHRAKSGRRLHRAGRGSASLVKRGEEKFLDFHGKSWIMGLTGEKDCAIIRL